MPGTFTYTVSTNIVVVTGGTAVASADFASFVIADRAGTGTSLLAARAPASNVTLTYAVRPVELRAIIVKFIVAAKTAEADFLFITGTDAWDAAQTESIDVTAGNGTYTSTKRWRTITNIDCSDNPAGGGTVWADGTIAVTQDIWGVIWDKGNSQYQLNCFFDIGDNSTATYFVTKGEQIVQTVNRTSWINRYTANATVVVGESISGTMGKNPSCFITLQSSSGYAFFSDGGGAFNVFAGLFYAPNTSCTLNVDKLYNAILGNNIYPAFGITSGTYDCYNAAVQNASNGLYVQSNVATVQNLEVQNCTYGVYLRYGAKQVVKNSTFNVITNLAYSNAITADKFLINCASNIYGVSWTGTNTGSIYRQLILDIEVQDELGNAISGAACTLTDVAAGVVWNAITTDANGNIAATGEDGSGETNSISYKRYYYSGGAQTTTYGPWTLTVSKAGYKAETVFIGTDEAELWEANLGGKITVTLSRAGIPPYFTEYAND